MRFNWLGFEVSGILPNNWQEKVIDVARTDTVFRDLPRTPITTRENPDIIIRRRGRVSGEVVAEKLSWLYKEYHTTFLQLATKFTNEEIFCAKDIRYGVVLNVAIGNEMCFECHVDSNPLEGLLFCTTHPPGTGGDLVVANNQDAWGIEEVDANASHIYPVAGQLAFFDARKNPHYVRRLIDKNSIRVVAAMNYYTESFPESTRPAAINQYLFGKE
jgi:hypothetical protein